jgi:hypothetical protein
MALLATLLIVMVLYVLVVVSLTRSDMILSVTSRARQKLQNEYLAQSGLNKMIEQVNLDPDWLSHHLRSTPTPPGVIPAEAQELVLTPEAPPIYLWAEPGANSHTFALIAQCGRHSVSQRRQAQVNLADEIIPTVFSVQDNPAGLLNLKAYSYQTQTWSPLLPPQSMKWNGTQPELETQSGNPLYVRDLAGSCADTEGNLYALPRNETGLSPWVYRYNLNSQTWYLLPPFDIPSAYSVGGLCVLDQKLYVAVNLEGPTSQGHLLCLEEPEQAGQSFDPTTHTWSAASASTWQKVCDFPAVHSSEFPPFASQLEPVHEYPHPMVEACAGGGAIYLARVQATASFEPRFWRWDGQQWALLPHCPAQHYQQTRKGMAILDDSQTPFRLTGLQCDEEGVLYTGMTPLRRTQLELPALYKFEPSRPVGDFLEGTWKSAGLACPDAPELSQPNSLLDLDSLAGNGQSLFVKIHSADSPAGDPVVSIDPSGTVTSGLLSGSQLLYRVDTAPLDSQPGQALSPPDAQRPTLQGSDLVYSPGDPAAGLKIVAAGGHNTGRKVARVVSWY